MTTTFIAPGATLGIVGGGQLGRMFVQAAQSMGYSVAVLDPDPTSPAGRAARWHIERDYLDPAGLAQLAERCAAISIEFENVPAAALATLAVERPLAPSADAVAICQDRAAEKAHFERCGVACAPHALIDHEAQLGAVDAALFPGLLKTTRLGYDGKGQVAVADRAALGAAWQTLQRQRCVLERRLALAAELSVIVARNAAGGTVGLPVQRNVHRDGILAVTTVPAGFAPALERQALDAALRIAARLHYVGVLCVEFFVVDDGSSDGALIANEMAPRPHNSGHYSIDACDMSQFELQVRTLTGAPLVTPRLHSCAVMLNLLGDLWFDGARERTLPWPDVLALPGAHLHLYGKQAARRGRKMGHLTLTAATLDGALANARRAAARLGLAPP